MSPGPNFLRREHERDPRDLFQLGDEPPTQGKAARASTTLRRNASAVFKITFKIT
jgi:hypothetical protein